MRTIISRWLMFGLLIGWSLSHANVFGQPTTGKSAPTADKIRANLDKAVTFDYTAQSLNDLFNHFRDKTGVTITVDGTANPLDPNAAVAFGPNGAPIETQYHLKANNEKASQVLRKLLNKYELTYIIVEDSVLITLPDTAVARQMTQRVSVELEDVSFKKAVRELAKKHGINLVIDPKVMVQADTQVSLQVENTGIETAVRLLSELAGLKAVRMGNVMFVTNEEKAKKIREEEKDQFDNPLNPNVPAGVFPYGYSPRAARGVAAPMFQGAGGFGGVVPAPPPIGVPIAPAPNNVPPGPPVELPPAPKNAPGAPPPVQPLPPPVQPLPPPVIERPAPAAPVPPAPPPKY